MNARAVVPQQRERVYFVGFRSDLTHAINSFEWPQLPVRHCTVGSILEPADQVPSEYILTAHQWEKVKDKHHAIVHADGAARTLIGGYKRNFRYHSDFVAVEGCPRPRFFTPRECARLQGFPDHFVIETERTNAHRFYHQIGNAVVPPVVELVARAMMLALRPSVSSSEL